MVSSDYDDPPSIIAESTPPRHSGGKISQDFLLPNEDQITALKKSLNGDDVRTMTGQGSAGNVIAALCSFFIPGLGQLVQGRLFMAAIHFVLAFLLWFILLGWAIHLWSILDAALFEPRNFRSS